MQTYFETDYVLTSYDENSNSIINQWKMPPLPVEYREGLKALLLAMEHFKTGKVVADSTNFGTLHPNDQEWSSTEWTDMAIKVGYSHIAIILPNDVYAQMAIEETMTPITTIATAYFNNQEAAIEWIKQS